MHKIRKDTGIIVVAIFLFMIVAIPTGGQAPVPIYPEPGLKWHNPTQSDVPDVAVGDLTGNGVADVAYVDVLAPTTLSAVYGINGTEYWTNSSVSGYSIAVGDVDGDGKNEVVAGGWNTNEKETGITVYEDNGTVKFFYETSSSLVKDIELGDVDNDGLADIVACNLEGYGWIYAFNGTERGNLPGWPKYFPGESIEDLALGNLDGNPGLDIAAISLGLVAKDPFTLYVFNSTGDLMWRNDTVWGRSVEIGDVDGDTVEEVVIGDQSSSHVYVYNGSNGTVEYSFDTIIPPSEVELGDLDGDPNDLEIAVITDLPPYASLFALTVNTGQLNELWNFSIEWEPTYYGEGLAIGDIDGDGGNEVIALSDSDDYGGGFKVWAFDGLDGNGDGQGDVVWMFALPEHPNDVEVGDVDDDGDMEVIVGTDHELAGSVYALFTKQPALEVNKTVWDPVNETWVKELTAEINDTLRFNCTITNTGNVNLSEIRFWDILDCSLEFAGNSTLTNASGEVIDIDLHGDLKPKVLLPYNFDWDLDEPEGEDFYQECPEPQDRRVVCWEDTDGDKNVSACDQIRLTGLYYGTRWYHVDRVPLILYLVDENGDEAVFYSVLNWDELVSLGNLINTTWLNFSVCGCKDQYTITATPEYEVIIMRNDRTREEVLYEVLDASAGLVVSREFGIDNLLEDTFILEPDQTITIEYDATVVRCGVDYNTFRAKGVDCSDGDWEYSNEDKVKITVPCPALEVNKTVWNGTAWVKALNASIGDTLQFNCTITNIGVVNLEDIRFWDILDCSLAFAGNVTLTNASGFVQTVTPPCAHAHCFKPQVLHPRSWWNPTVDLPVDGFTELCPESQDLALDPVFPWIDTDGDGHVSVCDQIQLGNPEGSFWAHVDRVPFTLKLETLDLYFVSVLNWDDPEMNFSDPINSTWLEGCCKDQYTLIDWQDFGNPQLSKLDLVTLRNERTQEVVEHVVEDMTYDLVVSLEWELDDIPYETGTLEPYETIIIEYNATVVRCGVDNNTFCAKGNNSGIWYYSDPDIVTITVPCPSADATDSAGAPMEIYYTNETVYATGCGFKPNSLVNIYITEDKLWVYGMNINSTIYRLAENVSTNASGCVFGYPLWLNPNPGTYDLVIDANRDGKLDLGDGIDGLNGPGFMVLGQALSQVPALTPVGIIALISLLSAIAAVAIVRKRR